VADDVGGRATTLRDKLAAGDRKEDDKEVETWKKQVEMLKGEDDKKLFSKVPVSKRVVC